MRLFDQLGYAGNAIKTRKVRAGLTTLGISIGIAAIVALLALSNGFQAEISRQFELGFSTNVLYVTKNTEGPDPDFELHLNDSDVISGLSPHIDLVLPYLRTNLCNVTIGGQNYSLSSVGGVNFTAFHDLFPTTFVTTNGSIPIEDSNTSVVIGSKITKDPYNYKVGDNITLTWFQTVLVLEPAPHQVVIASHNRTFPVAAILPEIGGFGIGGPSDSGIYIQLTPAIEFFNTTVTNSIIVRIDSANPDQSVIDNVTAAIKNAYGKKINIISPTAILNTINRIFGFISIFIAGIAGISLVVAGIGIMNVQITSVLERTREIGILKVLGAKDRTVLSAFLFETLFIGLLGSALGIGIGWILSIVFGVIIGGTMTGGGMMGGDGGSAASNGFRISPILTPELILWAVIFGVIVAIVFGLYPASRASRLKPVDALRSE